MVEQSLMQLMTTFHREISEFVEIVQRAEQSSASESNNEGGSSMMLSSERVTRQELVKEEIRCRICLGILWEPKECKVCETCFCGKCLD